MALIELVFFFANFVQLDRCLLNSIFTVPMLKLLKSRSFVLGSIRKNISFTHSYLFQEWQFKRNLTKHKALYKQKFPEHIPNKDLKVYTGSLIIEITEIHL